jgi:hypothetical protein
MLAALPGGAGPVSGGASVLVLALPYLAGALGGILLARAAPTPAVELAPLWGFACGVVTGCVTGILAAFSGGPLGSGRLAAVGPSGWQAAVVATLEVGVAAAVAAGLANWIRVRTDPELAAARALMLGRAGPRRAAGDDGHEIYVDPWADQGDGRPQDRPDPGPADLP